MGEEKGNPSRSQKEKKEEEKKRHLSGDTQVKALQGELKGVVPEDPSFIIPEGEGKHRGGGGVDKRVRGRPPSRKKASPASETSASRGVWKGPGKGSFVLFWEGQKGHLAGKGDMSDSIRKLLFRKKNPSP